MANKPLNSRIQLKHDTGAHWELAQNFSPLAGEVIIYDTDDENAVPRIKVGDGSTNVNNLPFLGSERTSLIVTTTNDVESDELICESPSPYEGQLVFIFLSKGTLGVDNMTITFSDDVTYDIYLVASTQLYAGYGENSILGTFCNSGALYMINPPVAIGTAPTAASATGVSF